MPLSFEWDKKKATTNVQKYKVSFDEAATVFDDPLAHILMMLITCPMNAAKLLSVSQSFNDY